MSLPSETAAQGRRDSGGNSTPSSATVGNASAASASASASAAAASAAALGATTPAPQRRGSGHGPGASSPGATANPLAMTMTTPAPTHSRPNRRASLRGLHTGLHRQRVAAYIIDVDGDDGGIEMRSSCERFRKALEIRARYKNIDKGQTESTEKPPVPVSVYFDEGIIYFSDQTTMPVSWEQYFEDVTFLFEMLNVGQCRASAKNRLQILEEKYNLYRVMNAEIEESADKYRKGGGVFADVPHVDNNVRLATCVNGRQLLEFVQTVSITNQDDVVGVVAAADGTRAPQTLKQLFASLDLEDPSALTVEGLGIHPNLERRFHCFDPFHPDLATPTATGSDLLKVFLTRRGTSNGRYLADLVRPVMDAREGTERYIEATEYHVEIQGTGTDEWGSLARYLQANTLGHHQNNRWIITIPRIQAMRPHFKCEFQLNHLENLFSPLFAATLTPDEPKHADVAWLLSHIGGFCIASDESDRQSDFTRRRRPPGEVPWRENPCDLYFAYYVWANLCNLNAFRRRKGMNTFQLRAVAGEKETDLDRLVFSYLLCDNVSHGVALQKFHVLQYLYGLSGVGVVMSPLGNNACGGSSVSYLDSPFPSFFRRSLAVTLATEHPLHFHHSTQPLQEEYATASKLFKLNGIDMTEIARTSVMLSSFSHKVKRKWLGDGYLDGPQGNVPEKTNIPTMRLEFRDHVWKSEHEVINNAARRKELVGAAGSPLQAAPSGALLSHSHHQYSNNAHSLSASPAPHPPEANNDRRDSNNAGSPFAAVLQLGATGAHKGALASYSIIDGNVAQYPRVTFCGPSERDAQHSTCAQLLHQALGLRSAYVRSKEREAERRKGNRTRQAALMETALSSKAKGFNEDSYSYSTVSGVVTIHEKNKVPRVPDHIHTYEDFRVEMAELKKILDHALVKAFAHRRLQLLEHKFRLHLAVNYSKEAGATNDKASQNRDFYQATKVDTSVRMESGMTARQLLNFIVHKAKNNGDDIVSQRPGEEPQTLRQLLDALRIVPDSLTVDDLNVQVDPTLGVGGAQFTPEGRDELLTLLLKTDNEMRGRYFAELTKLTFDQFKRDRFTFAENRLPIYGAAEGEWESLSSWFDTHGMACYNNQWMIQIPRIYSYLRKTGRIKSFADFLNNIFRPLWRVSLHPSRDRGGPRLLHFLNHVSGFDCVEDEKRQDIPLNMALHTPEEWTSEDEPPYNYYLYHIWANIRTLNEFRLSRGFSSFDFRPSCGETGSLDHLAGAFLLADGISYGLSLRSDSSLQYLFYLAQIGIAVSPLSNNTNVLDYLDNPFPLFFRRGLNVSLSTDGPLQFHHTQEPLIEEYSIASKVWKLSPNDMCEIARNSVLQSGFDDDFKSSTIGRWFFLSSSAGNDADRTHLSDIRVAYRWETYMSEIALLQHVAGLNFPCAMYTLVEEQELTGRKEGIEQHRTDTIIVAENYTVDLQKLRQLQTSTQKQLDEVTQRVEDIKRQNKLLSETLGDAVQRDAAAQQLRKLSGDSRRANGDDIDLGGGGDVFGVLRSSHGSFGGADESGAFVQDSSRVGSTPTGPHGGSGLPASVEEKLRLQQFIADGVARATGGDALITSGGGDTPLTPATAAFALLPPIAGSGVSTPMGGSTNVRPQPKLASPHLRRGLHGKGADENYHFPMDASSRGFPDSPSAAQGAPATAAAARKTSNALAAALLDGAESGFGPKLAGSGPPGGDRLFKRVPTASGGSGALSRNFSNGGGPGPSPAPPARTGSGTMPLSPMSTEALLEEANAELAALTSEIVSTRSSVSGGTAGRLRSSVTGVDTPGGAATAVRRAGQPHSMGRAPAETALAHHPLPRHPVAPPRNAQSER